MSFNDLSRRDVCLLSNIMELGGILVLKWQKKKKKKENYSTFRKSCSHCAFLFYWINLKLIFIFNNFTNLKWSMTNGLDWILLTAGCWILLCLLALTVPPRVHKFCFMHRTKRRWLIASDRNHRPPDHLHHLTLSCAKQPHTSGSTPVSTTYSYCLYSYGRASNITHLRAQALQEKFHFLLE